MGKVSKIVKLDVMLRNVIEDEGMNVEILNLDYLGSDSFYVDEYGFNIHDIIITLIYHDMDCSIYDSTFFNTLMNVSDELLDGDDIDCGDTRHFQMIVRPH